MQPKNTAFLALTCIILISLAGCAKYNARPMKPIVTEQSPEQSISFSYKVFNAYDCKKYLGKDTIAKGYQPIQITIINNSNHSFDIGLDSFNCDCISPEEVAEKMHTNTVGRAVGYGIPAWILFFPLAIPAIVDSVGSSKANKKLDADYEHKSVDSQTIAPYATINGLIFIPSGDDTHHINVTLVDRANHQRCVLSRIKPTFMV